MKSVNIVNHTENNIKGYTGKTTIELLEESRRIQQEGWRPLNRGWVADFSSNMNTNVYNTAVVDEVPSLLNYFLIPLTRTIIRLVTKEH